ncbi:MAG: ABC transporter permease [Vicinamibacterales bacterium]
MEAGLILRLCLGILRAASRVVPSRDRDAWLQEWEAELRERWMRLARRNGLNRRQQIDLLRRILGSFRDAAWLRRQFTRDSELVHDVRHGLRLLRRSPGFAALGILVLALGVGAAVGIFSVVDTLLLRALPYPNAERAVMLWQSSARSRDVRDDVAPANCLDYEDHLQSFDIVACVAPWSFDFTGGGEPEVLHAASVSNGFFRVFGVEPILGRTFDAEEHLSGRSRVIVISHGVWQQKLGGDPNVIGRTIRLDDAAYTVAGVLPPGFQPRILQGSGERGVYVPKVRQEHERRVRGSGYWNAVARLDAGVTLADAQGELDALSQRLAGEYPRTNAGVVAVAQPMREHLAGNLRPALRLLFFAVGLLLVIAAANVANLLLARAAERTRELAVRSAVGAGRARLVRQLLAESLLLATLGSVAGIVVAWWTVRLIVTLSPANIPSLANVTIDGRVLAFAAGLTGVVAVVVGIVPAWHCSGGRLLDILRGTTPASGGGTRHHVRAAIAVAEVALALLLMTGAGLLLRSFATLVESDPGFNPDRVLAMQVFAWDRNDTPVKRAVFVRQVLERIAALPGVDAAGAVSAMPFIEANINIETGLIVEGPPVAPGEEPGAFLTIATPGYFPTMQIALRRGRLLDEHDSSTTGPVAVVSESLARRAWPGTDAIGRRIRFPYQGQMRPAEVVGVVADVRHDSLDRPPRPELFVPHAQMPFGSMTFVARTRNEPDTIGAAMKEAIRAVDPLQAIYRAATARELVAQSLVERRFMLALLGGFALLAAVLAAIGIYGVISVATTQRTREFGVRMALGADRGEILGMVLREGATMAVVGLAIGFAGVIVFGRVIERFLYNVSPADPATLAGVAALLAVVALMACVLPARRATRVDPIVALRSD